MIAIAAADPSPAAVITCARGLAALPAAQTPGTLVRPVASTRTKPPSSTSQPSDVDQAVVACVERRPDEDRGARDRAAVGELDGVEAVVDDDEPRDAPVDDRDAARVQRRRARSR